MILGVVTLLCLIVAVLAILVGVLGRLVWQLREDVEWHHRRITDLWLQVGDNKGERPKP